MLSKIIKKTAAVLAAGLIMFGTPGISPASDGNSIFKPMIAQAADCIDDYPSYYKNIAKDAKLDEWGFYNRECTSFVAWRLNSRNNFPFKASYGNYFFGDACTWGYVAKNAGFKVDMNPAPGSVMWQDNGGYGHVLWVNSVNSDGTVRVEEYNWPDSNGIMDGAYHTRNIQISAASGFIHFKDLNADPPVTPPTPGTTKNITEGTYRLKNIGSGNYMNYAWGTSDPNPIWIHTADGSPEQNFTLKYVSNGKYKLIINHSDGGYVNCECPTPSDIRAGVKLTGRKAYNDDTQYFWITEVKAGSGKYIIQSGANKQLVVAPTSTASRTQLMLQTYTGKDLQKWTLEAVASTTTTTTKKTTTTTTTTKKPVTTTTTTSVAIPKPASEKNIAEGIYNIVNVKSGNYMNYAWGTSDPNPIWIHTPDGSPEQKFTLKYVSDGKYKLVINHSDGGYVNCECPEPEDIKAGVKLTGRKAFNDDTQYFHITPVGNGEYIFQNGYDKSLVIAATSETSRTQLVMQKYTGNDLQKWTLKALEITDPVTTASTTKKTTTTTTTTTTKKPTTTTTTTKQPTLLYGDLNCDGNVDSKDLMLIKMYLDDPAVVVITEQGLINADSYYPGSGITQHDADALEKYLAGAISLPIEYIVSATTTTATPESTTTTTSSASTGNKTGDVNSDGTINLKDVVVMRRYIAGGWGVELDENIADINKDSAVNLKDVVLLRRYIAGGWGVTL